MNQETCAVLTAVFPIVMLTVAVERRSIHRNIGRLKWFRRLSVTAIVSAFIGLGTVLYGVQVGGLDNVILVSLAWLAAGASIGTLTAVLIAVLATAEAAEDGPAVVANS